MQLQVSADDLRPVVTAVVTELIEQRALTPLAPDRLAYTEAQAAELIGLPKHVLRDARLRGEVCGKLVGKKMLYTRKELDRFLTVKGNV